MDRLAGDIGWTAFIPEPLALYRQHPAQLFGVARRGPRETLARLLGAGPEAHEQVADLRTEHARYLRDLAGADCVRTTDRAMAKNLEQAAALREHSAEAWRGRAGIYDRRAHRGERLERLVQLARNGGYREAGAGGLGRAALVRDLSFALT
jgi:hypothetical protein